MATQRDRADEIPSFPRNPPARSVGSDRSRNNQEAVDTDSAGFSRIRKKEKEKQPLIYDSSKKESAMAACADEHLEYLVCMRSQSSLALIWGQSEECRAKHKAFWECYGRHRGVQGNRIAAWLARPVLPRDALEGREDELRPEKEK
ncbi:hypothetical protein CLOP_g5633 [Closterium sp. NIES-67]|nr:hypothetical protein CLOP_g5633 [Closterium sp. NIES-67]